MTNEKSLMGNNLRVTTAGVLFYMNNRTFWSFVVSQIIYQYLGLYLLHIVILQ